MIKTQTLINKPVYLDFWILDPSKMHCVNYIM